MDSHALTHTDTTASEVTAPRGGRSRLLLLGGAVGGPLFTVVVAAQALTRVGFDLAHQPLSLLSLGELGWVQVTNFVLAGTLMVGLALGMRRVLTAGPGRIWAPRLMATFGVGLILGGVFVPDPALGYPPGRRTRSRPTSAGTAPSTPSPRRLRSRRSSRAASCSPAGS